MRIKNVPPPTPPDFDCHHYLLFFLHSCEQLPPTHLISNLLIICMSADSTNTLEQQMNSGSQMWLFIY